MGWVGLGGSLDLCAYFLTLLFFFFLSYGSEVLSVLDMTMLMRKKNKDDDDKNMFFVFAITTGLFVFPGSLR